MESAPHPGKSAHRSSDNGFAWSELLIVGEHGNMPIALNINTRDV